MAVSVRGLIHITLWSNMVAYDDYRNTIFRCTYILIRVVSLAPI
jgi:hypothetical protein